MSSQTLLSWLADPIAGSNTSKILWESTRHTRISVFENSCLPQPHRGNTLLSTRDDLWMSRRWRADHSLRLTSGDG